MIISSGPPRRRRGGRRLPWMVLVLGLLMLAAMLFVRLAPAPLEEDWSARWGFQPTLVAEQLEQAREGRMSAGLLTLLTAVFLHASWLHLGGNLAYLWVFGMPVERAVGPWLFLLAFLFLSGITHLVLALTMSGQQSVIIGASGGVSATIGVYLGLFPRRKIGLWLPLGLFLQFARIPALLVIGSWFTLQLVYTVFGPMSDAVAWRAHVTGFVAGLLLALPFRLLSGTMFYRNEDG